MVGLGGFEPPTSPLSEVRSDQLSYRPAESMPPLGPEQAGAEAPVARSEDKTSV